MFVCLVALEKSCSSHRCPKIGIEPINNTTKVALLTTNDSGCISISLLIVTEHWSQLGLLSLLRLATQHSLHLTGSPPSARIPKVQKRPSSNLALQAPHLPFYAPSSKRLVGNLARKTSPPEAKQRAFLESHLNQLSKNHFTRSALT